ncbi:hypothetical protein BH10CYA1_BH10CYA1_22680 [soil metagenome]
MIMLNDEFPEVGCLSGESSKGVASSIYLYKDLSEKEVMEWQKSFFAQAAGARG